jgi:MarR family transcriptional regulator, transcriptional regulator for hemolysin
MDHIEFLGRRLAMTAKVVRAYADQQMAIAGSSLTVAIVTRILAARPDLAQRELADALGIEGPTMARHIDRLERDGIVSRQRDADDRRVLRVRLTEKGYELRDRLIGVSASTHEQVAAVFEPDELTQFEEYLDRLGAHAAGLLQGSQEVTAR